MAYYFRKKLKGKYYLFKGESTYENKTSVRKSSKYVGPFDELAEYFQQAEVSILHQEHREYGLSRTLYELYRQLGLDRIFQHTIKKKGDDPYLAHRVIAMILNRIAHPCAKYSLEKWYSKTDMPQFLSMPASELTSHKVYRTMDKLDQASTGIETAICKVISGQENISFDALYLDFTNQETYSRNKESYLLANGHNKRGFDKLYQLNLSLCCDVKTGIPFFHKPYPGNYNDKQFIKAYARELRERLTSVGWTKKCLLIMDRGINGKENFGLLRDTDFDYIGGLIQRDFPTYFATRRSDMRKQYSHKREGKDSLLIQYTERIEEVYGEKHKVIIFHNEENRTEKKEEFEEELVAYERECELYLQECQKEIAQKTFQSRRNNVKAIRKKLNVLNKRLFPLLEFKITSYRFELTWEIKRNQQAINRHTEAYGNYVLFTNRTDLPPKKILTLFFEKDKIEKNFQFLKANAYTNRAIVLGPMLHAKDRRIESHVYTCIMALQLYQIIRYRLKKKDIGITTQQALEELQEISCFYTKIAGKRQAIRHINQLTDTQKKILRALQLKISE